MKLWALIAGFAFLSNPNIGIIDFLPDVFGYLLIIHALGVAPVIVPYFNDAAKGAVRMFAVSVLKLLCLPLLGSGAASLSLVLSFSFAILEPIFLIPTLCKLFDGFAYVGMRYDVPSILAYREKEKITRDASSGEKKLDRVRVETLPKLKRAAVAFVALRSAISLIPNVADLQLTDPAAKAEDASLLRLSDLTGLFTAAALLLGAVCMLIWLVRTVPFFVRVSKDEKFRSPFLALCERTKNDPVVSRGFRMTRVTVLLGIAVVCSTFVLPDGVNYVPGAIPAALIVLAALLLRSRGGNGVFVSVICAVGCAAFSVLELFARRTYFVELNNEPEAALWSALAARNYEKVEYFTLADRALLLAAFLSVFVILFRVWTRDFHDDGDGDMYELEAHSRASRRFKLAAVSAIPIFLLTAAEPWLSVGVDVASTVLTVVSALWALFAVFALIDVRKDRWLLDGFVE